MSKLKKRLPGAEITEVFVVSDAVAAGTGGSGPEYDLKERAAKLGVDAVRFARALPADAVNQPLISQIVRSGTSIGANYMEADGADSGKDFRYKIALCRKEAKETMHWSQMLAEANPTIKSACRDIWRGAHELVLIFSAILAKCRKSR